MKLVHGQVDARTAKGQPGCLLAVVCELTVERLHIKCLLQRHADNDKDSPLLLDAIGTLHVMESTLECEPAGTDGQHRQWLQQYKQEHRQEQKEHQGPSSKGSDLCAHLCGIRAAPHEQHPGPGV